MFLSGVIWTKSFELFAHQRERKPVLPGAVGSCRGRLYFFFCWFFWGVFLQVLQCSSSIVQIHFCYIDKQAC